MVCFRLIPKLNMSMSVLSAIHFTAIYYLLFLSEKQLKMQPHIY